MQTDTFKIEIISGENNKGNANVVESEMVPN